MSKYYYGFRQTIPRPAGQWVLCGPFDTYDGVKADRAKSKQWDCELSPWFAADSDEEAQAKIDGSNNSPQPSI
jgi:hypothetical protein